MSALADFETFQTTCQMTGHAAELHLENLYVEGKPPDLPNVKFFI